MKIKIIIVSILLTSLTTFALADDHSEAEAKKEIAKLQKIFKTLKSYNKIKFLQKDILEIKKYLSSASKNLKDGEEDLAYYNAGLGLAIANKIKAKKDYMKIALSYKKFKAELKDNASLKKELSEEKNEKNSSEEELDN
jgi:hypothetical protein